jgi:hypothetical protein
VNKVDLTGDASDDGDVGESVGVVIARTEVLLSLTSTPVGEITALDLAQTDAVTVVLCGWVPLRNPHWTDDEPAE